MRPQTPQHPDPEYRQPENERAPEKPRRGKNRLPEKQPDIGEMGQKETAKPHQKRRLAIPRQHRIADGAEYQRRDQEPGAR